MRRFMFPFFVLAILLWGAGPARPEPSRLDARLLEPNLVDVGSGNRLHLACVGEGAPTVVFEQGGEGSILNWRRVQPMISALTRTCFYDRAGFGFSDPPARPVTGVSVTDDLRALLHKAKIEGPIVLVGHSVGGFFATLYASRFRAQVAGMVLVDPGFVGQDLDWRIWRPKNLEAEQFLRKCAALAREGRLTRAAPQDCFTLPSDLRDDEAEYLLHALTRPAWYEAHLSLVQNYFPPDDGGSVSWRQALQARRDWGAMPLVVLTAGVQHRDAWLDQSTHERWVRHWRAGHLQLAAQSTEGEAVVVSGAGHFIQLSQPQAVIDAVSKVVDRVRSERPSTAD